MAKKSWKLAAISLAVLVAGGSVFAANASAGESISEAEAKQIALAEVKGADVSHISKFKKDKDDNREEYDVEIIYNGFEYDFEISAKDGKIFDRNKEKADADDIAKLEAQQKAKAEAKEAKADAQKQEQASSEQPAASNQSKSSSSSSSGISLDRAKSIALAQVSGASSGNISKAYKDYDDGRAEYDIEIRYNGYEYDFEIDGASGKILSKDVDRYASSSSSSSSSGSSSSAPKVDYDDDWDDRYDDDRYDDDRYDRDDDDRYDDDWDDRYDD